MWQIYAAVATVLAMILAAMRLFGGGKGAVAEATRNDDVGTGELPRRLREEAVRPGRARGNPQGVAAAAEESDSEGEGGAVAEDDEIDYTKMGKKKAMKMQAKAERKAAHEAMLAQQEDRRAREELREEERKTREAEEAAEAAREAEEERKRLEEIARQEEELYQSLKGEFSVEESGTIEDENTEEKLEQFIEYVESEKVVYVEQLAAKFRLTSTAVVARLRELEEMGRITGILDDRGKFVFISRAELDAVVRFVRQRGRVSIADLAAESNRLIKLEGVA